MTPSEDIIYNHVKQRGHPLKSAKERWKNAKPESEESTPHYPSAWRTTLNWNYLCMDTSLSHCCAIILVTFVFVYWNLQAYVYAQRSEGSPTTMTEVNVWTLNSPLKPSFSFLSCHLLYLLVRLGSLSSCLNQFQPSFRCPTEGLTFGSTTLYWGQLNDSEGPGSVVAPNQALVIMHLPWLYEWVVCARTVLFVLA